MKPDAGVTEPTKDLKKDNFSAIPETDEIVPVRVLKKEDFSTRLVAELNASDNDLNSDVCSVRVVAEPTETPRFSVLPVKRELPRVIDPINVRR